MKKYALQLFILVTFLSCSKDGSEFVNTTGQSGSITRFAIHNQYMYTLNPNGITTYHLDNPDKPKWVHTLTTDYGLETIFIYDNTIYLGSRTALYILSIDNPAAPKILSQTNRQEFPFGGCDPVVVRDQYAYSTIKIIPNICGTFWNQSALLVYDVTNKSAPIQKGSYAMNLPNGLGFSNEFLFVCDEGANKVQIYNTTDPLSLTLTSYSFTVMDPIDIIIKNDKAIISSKSAFRFYDISNLEDIRPLGLIKK